MPLPSFSSVPRSVLCSVAVCAVTASNLLRGVLATGSYAATATAHAARHATRHAAAGSAASSEKALFAWWEMVRSGDAWSLLSPRWWFEYIRSEYAAEPAHVIVETVCIVTILYLMFWRKPAPLQQERLTKKEEDELIAEWKPEPLCPAWEKTDKTRFIVESATGRTVVANGESYLNFASMNFLGLADKPQIKSACRATIEKYGVGSCGPRGFYGTFDLHLEIEAALAKFMQAEECILYSDAIASVSSVIPAFAKKGDTIVVDDSTNFGIQQGCLLSRSTIHYFKHGDMADLEKVLAGIAAKEAASKHKHSSPVHRKFIVVEGVSSIYGDILPLDRVLELKAKYAYRLIMDDTLGVGVLGEHGRGTIEHHGKAMQGSTKEPGVDILCAAMDGAIASVGGFCVGNHQVVDHQRLSGAGYCFSASSPPYTSTASLITLGMIDAEPSLGAGLRKKAAKVRRALAGAHRALVVCGGPESDVSPVIHLAVKNSKPDHWSEERRSLERLADFLRVDSRIIACVPEFIPADRARTRVPPTIKIMLSTLHTEQDIEKLVKAITNAANKALAR